MTYSEVSMRVFDAIRALDVRQHDAHIWQWLDHEAGNANHLRFAIVDTRRNHAKWSGLSR